MSSSLRQSVWRLPSKDELVALSLALKGGLPFTGVQSSFYWSSTTNAVYTDGAWVVNMRYGNVYTLNETDANHVWPVRAGQ